MTPYASFRVCWQDDWRGVDEDGDPVRIVFKDSSARMRLRFENASRTFSIQAESALIFLRQTRDMPPERYRDMRYFRFPMVNHRQWERALVRAGAIRLNQRERRRCLSLGIDLRYYEPGPRIRSLMRWLEQNIAKAENPT